MCEKCSQWRSAYSVNEIWFVYIKQISATVSRDLLSSLYVLPRWEFPLFSYHTHTPRRIVTKKRSSIRATIEYSCDVYDEMRWEAQKKVASFIVIVTFYTRRQRKKMNFCHSFFSHFLFNPIKCCAESAAVSMRRAGFLCLIRFCERNAKMCGCAHATRLGEN